MKIVTGAVKNVLKAASQVGVGVVISNVKGRKDGKVEVQCVLRPISDKFRLIRVNPFTGRRRKVWAVCLHGHYEFIGALFRIDPSSWVVSSLARANGFSKVTDDNLEEVYEALRGVNIGSIMFPQYYDECCDC